MTIFEFDLACHPPNGCCDFHFDRVNSDGGKRSFVVQNNAFQKLQCPGDNLVRLETERWNRRHDAARNHCFTKTQINLKNRRFIARENFKLLSNQLVSIISESISI